MAIIRYDVFEALFGRCPDYKAVDPKFANGGERRAYAILANFIRAETVLEFGINEGRTAQALLLNTPTIYHYTGVDVRPDYRMASRQQSEVPAQAAHLVQHDPKVSLLYYPESDTILKDRRQRYDFIFVDGDHSYAGVKHDTELALQLIRPGGVILWHDYKNVASVTEYINELNARNDRICWLEGTWLCFSFIAGKG